MIIFKTLKEKAFQKNTIPDKIILYKWRRGKVFPTQKPREFVTTRPALQEMLNQRSSSNQNENTKAYDSINLINKNK